MLKDKKDSSFLKLKKEIEQLNKAAIKNRKNKHGPQFLGIGGALRSYSSWDNIKEYAETQGIYTALDLRKIIHDNSPIKKIGDHNLTLAMMIDEEMDRTKTSFYTACLNKFPELCVVMSIDPNKVHMGANWEAVQKQKNKKFKRTNYKYKYVKVIENMRSKYKRVTDNSPEEYKSWCILNKKNNNYKNFISATLAFLKKIEKEK